MVARTYYGLGPREVAVARFDSLAPFVVELLGLQAECPPMGMDYMAVGISLDGLETAAFHFTRRRNVYHRLQEQRPPYRDGNGRLGDAQAAIAAFEPLAPCAQALRLMQGGCRPFGADYLAIAIALESLDTTAFHFTREACLFGAKSDSAGPLGRPR